MSSNTALYLWWGAVVAFILMCLYFGISQATSIELVGSSTGTGDHNMTIEVSGSNLTREEAILVMASHGYNVTRDGSVWIASESWNITAVI